MHSLNSNSVKKVWGQPSKDCILQYKPQKSGKFWFKIDLVKTCKVQIVSQISGPIVYTFWGVFTETTVLMVNMYLSLKTFSGFSSNFNEWCPNPQKSIEKHKISTFFTNWVVPFGNLWKSSGARAPMAPPLTEPLIYFVKICQFCTTLNLQVWYYRIWFFKGFCFFVTI